MESSSSLSGTSATVLLLLIYSITGALGLLPALLATTAFLLAKNTTISQSLLEITDSYRTEYKQALLKELSTTVQRDVVAKVAIESAGLRAELKLVSEHVRTLQEQVEKKEETIQRSASAISRLEHAVEVIKGEYKALKTQADAQKAESSKAVDELKNDAQALKTESQKLREQITLLKAARSPPAETNPAAQPVQPAPSSIARPAPTPVQSRLLLPNSLASLKPSNYGFTCIGRSTGSHQGPCRSISDEYLPKSILREAAAILDSMREHPSGSDFELAALQDLANKMLCKFHRRGCKHDQVNGIASQWYRDLAPVREQLRVQASTPLRASSSREEAPGSAGSAGSRASSPASSVVSDASTTATTPEQFGGSILGSGAKNGPVVFRAGGGSVNVGTPTPARRRSPSENGW